MVEDWVEAVFASYTGLVSNILVPNILVSNILVPNILVS